MLNWLFKSQKETKFHSIELMKDFPGTIRFSCSGKMPNYIEVLEELEKRHSSVSIRKQDTIKVQLDPTEIYEWHYSINDRFILNGTQYLITEVDRANCNYILTKCSPNQIKWNLGF